MPVGRSEQQKAGHLLLRRPGKSAGHSATFGYVGPGVLNNFSSNAHPFAKDHGYGPFAIYTLLCHGGDYHAAAKALYSQGYGTRRERVTVTLEVPQHASGIQLTPPPLSAGIVLSVPPPPPSIYLPAPEVR